MKLNTDCIRDILLTIEEETDFEKFFSYEKNHNNYKKLTKYDHNEIAYHIKQCKLSNLIAGVSFYEDGDYININDLSPQGHEFLANIRSDSIFNKTKEIAGSIGVTSLKAFVQISTSVVTQFINQYLGF